jgi:hypothetical protein
MIARELKIIERTVSIGVQRNVTHVCDCVDAVIRRKVTRKKSTRYDSEKSSTFSSLSNSEKAKTMNTKGNRKCGVQIRQCNVVIRKEIDRRNAGIERTAGNMVNGHNVGRLTGWRSDDNVGIPVRLGQDVN